MLDILTVGIITDTLINQGQQIMTQDEVQALITEALTNFKSEIGEQINKSNQGLASNFTKELKKTLASIQSVNPSTEEVSEEPTEKLTLKTLKTQVEQLTKQLSDKDQQAFSARKSEAISKLVATTKNLNPSALQKLFTLEYGQYIKEENGQWYVEQGESTVSLSDALNGYLSTDEGKGLLPPSGVNGSGAIESKNITPNPSDKLSAADALYTSFL